MTNRLLTNGIWHRLTAQIKRRPGRCMVAVAYLGIGAIKLLPLRRGSILIVDMSRTAVGSGQTKPQEILSLIKNGVHVYSVQNLHAKVFVVGNRAFIGSTNVSNRSAKGLIEACLETDNKGVVASCKSFVKSLCGEPVTPDYAKRMERFYKPPKFGTPVVARSSRKKITPLHSPLWVVPLVRKDWDDEDKKQEKQGMPKAKRKLQSSQRFRVEDFCWTPDSFLDRVKEGDLVIQSLDEDDKIKMISPPAKVLPTAAEPPPKQ